MTSSFLPRTIPAPMNPNQLNPNQLNPNQLNPNPIPIGFRLRKDIAWQSQQDDRELQSFWIAEDPLTRRIFRCSDQEFQLLHWLDDGASYESIRKKFLARFAPATIELEQVHALVSKCAQVGLLLPTDVTRGAAKQPLTIWPTDRARAHVSSRSRGVISHQMRLQQSHWFLALIQWIGSWLQQLTQVQYPLGSPDRWIAPIAFKLGWIYSGAAICFWLSALGVALGLIAMRYEALLAELPDLQSLRSPGMLVGFGAIFLSTRVAHELGHAVACKRAGAACKDAGLMISFGMVCPYVDITDSWRIGNRFTRMGIALAGIYSECVLAVFASILWLATYPGWIHDTALQTLLVCTVTTLLFNANPLMKYDGYFVLCDWLNTQNLRERSFAALDTMLDGRSGRESFRFSLFLSGYFLASSLQRAVLMFGLLAMVYYAASQLQLAGLGLAGIVLYGCCWAITSMAAWTLAKKSDDGSRKLGKSAAWLGWTAVSLLIAWAVNMPLPSRVHSVGTFQMGDRQPIYSGQSGRIVQAVSSLSEGRLEADDVILSLENPAIEKRILELESVWLKKVCQLDILEKRIAFLDPRTGGSIPLLRSEIAFASDALQRERAELARLIIPAPSSGWFEAAVAIPADIPMNPSDMALGTSTPNVAKVPSFWTSPAANGRWMEQGTVIGWIFNDRAACIECNLAEEQVPGIQVGTEVRVSLLQSPREIFSGTVLEIARTGQIDAHPIGSPTQSLAIKPMTVRVRIAINEDRDWSLYSNGNAEVVFIKPNQSLVTMATNNWMRNSKLR